MNIERANYDYNKVNTKPKLVDDPKGIIQFINADKYKSRWNPL